MPGVTLPRNRNIQVKGNHQAVEIIMFSYLLSASLHGSSAIAPSPSHYYLGRLGYGGIPSSAVSQGVRSFPFPGSDELRQLLCEIQQFGLQDAVGPVDNHRLGKVFIPQ